VAAIANQTRPQSSGEAIAGGRQRFGRAIPSPKRSQRLPRAAQLDPGQAPEAAASAAAKRAPLRVGRKKSRHITPKWELQGIQLSPSVNAFEVSHLAKSVYKRKQLFSLGTAFPPLRVNALISKGLA